MTSPLTRRTFLNHLGTTSLGLMAGGPAFAESSLSFADSSAWKKHGELFRHHGEPANAWVQNFTSTVEPLEKDRWRIWTSISGPKGVAKNIGYHEGEVGGEWKRTMAVCTPGEPDKSAALAIGGLPEGWEPVQGVLLKLKNGRTRLYFWSHGKGAVRYLAADSDDGRAFKVLNASSPCLYHTSDRCVGGEAAVEIGLTKLANRKAKPAKGEAPAPAHLITNDATNVYQLPDGSFELYTVTLFSVPKDDPRYAANDNIPGLVRVIERLTSEDGLTWTNRKRVISPDAQDPQDLQFYYLSVTHTDKGRIGLLGHYRLGAQTMDIEACFSKDGITWERPLRKPWIPRDAPGTTAGSYLLHAPHAMVRRDGLWHLFYTGGNFAHNHSEKHGPAEVRAVMLATCEAPWK
ncbi:hypothetical protein [Brevifollis gellanilyticus]|uniref:Glycosyl hydrolase family 32 N-terminal domain-containing protein n=1 Tax=Brevifollis gellanilyticus TaxID=748831 RepID=A0A512MGU5_9BACT|nr:hypothetical protein [Brevifollis gellanilyticus]GEP45960.1 hypothetical protein BGE01nite_52510 [Brevifollis gellanilyticus]